MSHRPMARRQKRVEGFRPHGNDCFCNVSYFTLCGEVVGDYSTILASNQAGYQRTFSSMTVANSSSRMLFASCIEYCLVICKFAGLVTSRLFGFVKGEIGLLK